MELEAGKEWKLEMVTAVVEVVIAKVFLVEWRWIGTLYKLNKKYNHLHMMQIN